MLVIDSRMTKARVSGTNFPGLVRPNSASGAHQRIERIPERNIRQVGPADFAERCLYVRQQGRTLQFAPRRGLGGCARRRGKSRFEIIAFGPEPRSLANLRTPTDADYRIVMSR